jgi:ASC-1-like (ASCH) protein
MDNYEYIVSETVSESEASEESENEESENEGRRKKVLLFRFRDLENCHLYDQIIEGKKTVEGRKNSEQNQDIKIGDILLFSDKSRGILECEVTYVHYYSDIAEYLAGESLNKVFGDTSKCRNVKTIEEGVKIYREYVDENKILELKDKFGSGFIGIGIKFIHEYRRNFEDLNDEWFEAIKSGKKIAEGGLNKSWVRNLQKSDMIEFVKKSDPSQKIELIITKLKSYRSFYELFDDVGLDKVLPGKKTYEEGLAVYRQWYSEDKENKVREELKELKKNGLNIDDERSIVGIFFDIIKK